MNGEERHWWMALADSEFLLGRASKDDVLFHHEANVEIRRVLVKEFGQNLDTLQATARDEVLRLVNKAREKAHEEQVLRAEALRILDRGER